MFGNTGYPYCFPIATFPYNPSKTIENIKRDMVQYLQLALPKNWDEDRFSILLQP